jgi:hypothetical protein
MGVSGGAPAEKGPGASQIAAGNPASTTTPSPMPAVVVEPTDAATVEPTVSPTPEAIPAPPKPAVVKGSGTKNTKPFDLAAGDFTVTITGSGHSNVIADVIPRGGTRFDGGQSLFNEISDGKYKYETVVYGLEAGSYYLDMTNANAWVVTFSPLQ